MSNVQTSHMHPRLTRAESREATRVRLIDSAIDLYARHGVSAVSLALIAEHAGYSRGAFHSNFRDKAELSAAVAAAVIAELAPELQEIITSDANTLQRLGGYIRHYVRFCAVYPQKAQALIAIVRDEAQQHRGSYEARADDSLTDLVALFEAGQAAGEMRAFDTSIMALTLRSTLDAHSMRFTRDVDRPESGTPELGTPEDGQAPERTTDWQRMAEQIATTFQLATRAVDHD